MGRIVIVAYRPKPGQEERLLELVREHVPALSQEGLVTDRSPTIMRSVDGTVVELFEWKSGEAVDQAHTNPAVQALWARFEQVCDFVPLNDLAEARQLFAEFMPL